MFNQIYQKQTKVDKFLILKTKRQNEIYIIYYTIVFLYINIKKLYAY